MTQAVDHLASSTRANPAQGGAPSSQTAHASGPEQKSTGQDHGQLASAHRWVILAIGVAAQASFSAAFAGIPVTGPALADQYALTTGELGIVLGAILLGIAVTEIPWGILTDRAGDRCVLICGLLTTAAALSVTALLLVPKASHAPGLVPLVIAFFAVGALGGSVNGSSGRAVMAWFAEHERGFAMSIRQTAIPAGGAVGAVLLPWLAVTFGFRAVFGVLAAFCFLTAAAASRWLYEPARPSESRASADIAGDRSSDDRAVLTRWDVWRLALASGLLTVPQFAVLTFAAVYLTGTRGLDLAAAATCVLIVQVGGAAARVWSGRWTDRHRNRRTYVRTVGVLTATAMTVAAVAEQAPVALVAAAIVTAGVLASAWHGVAYTEIASMAGKSRAGAALGLENTTVFAAAFLTPVMIPVVLHLAGWWAVWAAAAVTSLVAVPLAPGRERVITLPPATS